MRAWWKGMGERERKKEREREESEAERENVACVDRVAAFFCVLCSGGDLLR